MADHAQFKAEGNKALTEKRFDDAITHYTSAIELAPTEHTYYSNRSAAYLSKGDAEAALLDAQKCTELQPTFAKGHGRVGAAYHKMQRYEEAAEAYEAGLMVCPGDSALQAGLAEVVKLRDAEPAGDGAGGLGGLFGPNMIAKLAGHPKFGPKLADPQFQMKLSMMKSNPQMMMQDPEMMEVLTAILGVSGMGMDTGDDAGGAFNPPPRQAPSSSSSSTSSASSWRATDDDSNLTPEERETKKRKAQAAAEKERGNSLYKDKQFPAAIAAYDAAIELDPTNILYLNNKVCAKLSEGRHC